MYTIIGVIFVIIIKITPMIVYRIFYEKN